MTTNVFFAFDEAEESSEIIAEARECYEESKKATDKGLFTSFEALPFLERYLWYRVIRSVNKAYERLGYERYP